MSLGDWFKRGRKPAATGDLRDSIMALLARKDYAALMSLINDNGDAIREAFPVWVKVPEEIRTQRDQVQAYASMLFMLASLFEKAGDPSLMARIKDDNPMEGWKVTLNEIQQLLDTGRPNEAIPLAHSLLDGLKDMTGTGVDHYRALALGRLGIALFNTGNRDEAIRVTREALELCRQAKDEEGIKAYTENLDMLGSFELPPDAEGATHTVSLKNEQGVTLSPTEFATTDGVVRWEVRGGSPIPPEAERLHDEARKAGERGDLDNALQLLTRAAELAPEWPYPIYDRAYTQLLRNDTRAALGDYQRTLALAPRGFFTAAVTADLLTRELAGEFPEGLCRAFVHLEHMPLEQRADLLEQIVKKHPSCAAAWSEYAETQPDAQKRLAAIDRGLAAPGDRDTQSLLLVKKAAALALLGEPNRALCILQPLANDASGSLKAQVLAQTLLKRLTLAAPSTPAT